MRVGDYYSLIFGVVYGVVPVRTSAFENLDLACKTLESPGLVVEGPVI